MMKSISIWVIGVVWLKFCDVKFLESAIVIKKADTVVTDFIRCEWAITEKALQYVSHKDAHTILLKAAGFEYKKNSLEGCLHVLEFMLPPYLEQLKMLLVFFNFTHVPITQGDFNQFSKILLTYFEKEMDGNMTNKLGEVLKRNLKNYEDFVRAFYDITILLQSKVDNPSLPQIHNLGINHLDYPGKSLLGAVVKKTEKLQEAKLITQTRLFFPAVFQYFQNQMTPYWILEDDLKFTMRTLWKIIVNQKNCLQLKILQERLKKCSPEKQISLDYIQNFVVKKFSANSNIMHMAGMFPTQLSEKQWKTVFTTMSLGNLQEKCLVRSIGLPIENEDIEMITKSERTIAVSEKVYVYLKHIPPYLGEHNLKLALEKHLVKFGQAQSTIVVVIKLYFEDRTPIDHRLVQFIDETSANNACNILKTNQMKLSNRTIIGFHK